jgi:hypothetical protein
MTFLPKSAEGFLERSLSYGHEIDSGKSTLAAALREYLLGCEVSQVVVFELTGCTIASP